MGSEMCIRDRIGEDTMEIFDGFDFAMLGDIHRRQILDDAGRIWYAGSTVQQNHGETNDKGILIWDIQSKTDWDVEPVVFKNPKPFITLELTPKGRMPKGANVPEGARLRIVSNNNLPLNVMKRAMDIAKHRFKPEVVTFLNRAAGQRAASPPLPSASSSYIAAAARGLLFAAAAVAAATSSFGKPTRTSHFTNSKCPTPPARWICTLTASPWRPCTTGRNCG